MRKAEVSHRCDVIDVRMSYRIELYKNTLLKIPHRSILLQTVILKAEAVMELLKDGNGKSDTTMPPLPPHCLYSLYTCGLLFNLRLCALFTCCSISRGFVIIDVPAAVDVDSHLQQAEDAVAKQRLEEEALKQASLSTSSVTHGGNKVRLVVLGAITILSSIALRLRSYASQNNS